MGCHALPPGDLPDPGIEPESLTSPALAGRFVAASATWEAHLIFYHMPKFQVDLKTKLLKEAIVLFI